MTVKPTVSLTDQGYDLAKSLVKSGKFASVSAVMQYGLRLVEREEESYRARLDAIRIDLERRVQESEYTILSGTTLRSIMGYKVDDDASGIIFV